jgi:hypothetical protein
MTGFPLQEYMPQIELINFSVLLSHAARHEATGTTGILFFMTGKSVVYQPAF